MIFSWYKVGYPEKMKTTKTSFNHLLEFRFNVLMKIRDFKEEVRLISKKIPAFSEQLIREYNLGLIFLSQHIDLPPQENAEKLVYHIQENSKLMNQALAQMAAFDSTIKNSPDFSLPMKTFTVSMDKFGEYSRVYERFGKKYLDVNQIKIWEVNFCVFDEKYAESLDNYSETLYLISKFFEKFDANQIESITKIIAENRIASGQAMGNEHYEIQNMKVIGQLKKALHPQNLWEKFMEILSSEAELSAKERIMLNRWKESERNPCPGK